MNLLFIVYIAWYVIYMFCGIKAVFYSLNELAFRYILFHVCSYFIAFFIYFSLFFHLLIECNCVIMIAVNVWHCTFVVVK